MNYLVVLLLAVAGLQLASAKIFETCELVDELILQGFNRNLLPDWVCLIDAHSHRDTSKVMLLEDGTTQWGLYQINDNYWCTSGNPGGLCNIACESMLTDDITIASICAKKVYAQNGFAGWQGWVQFCRSGAGLPDLTVCDIRE